MISGLFYSMNCISLPEKDYIISSSSSGEQFRIYAELNCEHSYSTTLIYNLILAVLCSIKVVYDTRFNHMMI